MRTPAAIVLVVLLAASVGARSAAALNAAPAANNGPFPIALFPVENLSGSKAPLREIREALAAGMRAKGLTIIDEETTERFLIANRIRYAAGVTSELGQALHADTGAAGILISVVELYDAAYPPRIGLICRLVAANERAEILWMDSAGLSGADAQGFLRLGVIEDPKQILSDAVALLADSLAAHYVGDRSGRRSDSGGYRPLRYYRSSALGKDLQIVRVGFARRASRVDGASGRTALHVALSAASAKRVTVDYAVPGGTARPGKDYELAPGTVVFEPGETVKEIAVAVKDRMRYDDDRTVEVRLAKAVNAAPGDTQAHTLVIVNTHPQPAVAFGEAVRRVREGAGTVAVPVRLTAVSGKDVTVPFTAAGTLAERAGYRVLTPSPLVIGAGSAGAEIAVEIVDDGLAEEEETVTLALDVPSGAVLGRAAALALHIEDDDPPPAASFAQERSRGAETAGPARLEVRLSGPSGRRVRVEYAVTGGTARGGAEFVLRGGALVFEPGETVRSIEAEVRPGDRHKEDRTLEVSLTRAEHAVLGGVRVHTYTIENTVPPPQVTFGEPSGSVEENAGVVAVPVRLTALSGKDVTVPFTVSGTAVEGRDYRVVTSSPAVIRAGRSAAEITLLVEDDRLQGEDKTIILTLGAPENAVPGEHLVHTVSVRETSQPPAAGFLSVRSGGPSGGGRAKLEVTLSTVSGKRITVDYAATGGTARDGQDYALKSGTVTFEPGETVKSIELEIKEAKAHDADRTVEVSLTKVVNAVPGGPQVHVYTIENDVPAPAVSFSASSATVQEDAGTVPVAVRLSAVSGKDVTVPFTVSGTAREQANYRIVTPGPLVIKAGERTAEIQVALVHNGINEDDRTVVLSLGDPVNAVPGKHAVQTLTIAERDPLPAVLFSSAGSSGKAGASPARLDVRLSAASGRRITVGYAATGGSAKNGKEYFLKGGALTFEPGETEKAVSVEIKQSTLHDDDKTVEVTLKDPQNAVLGGTRTHAYTIVNTVPSWPPAVGFLSARSGGRSGGGPAKLEVTLSAVSGKRISADYAATGGTARDRQDYALKSGTVTFEPGETVKNIELEIEEAKMHDDDRTVEVSLTKVVNAVPGGPQVHVYTIENDVPAPAVSFSASSATVQEDAGTVPVAVRLSAVSGKDVTVPFTVSGTAREQANYRIVTPGPLVIKAGERTAEIQVALVHNGINEDDRTVVLSLGDPVNAVPGKHAVQTLTIAERDPLPAVLFSSAGSSGKAGASPARLDVRLSAASGRRITVGYAATGGSAKNGKEYFLKGGALTFEPGETEKAVSVEIKQSTLHDDDKTVEVTLKDPQNAVPGGTRTHTHTIVNTAPLPKVLFVRRASRVDGASGRAALHVALSAASAKRVTVDYAVQGGTARPGKDYELAPGTVVFEPGETVKEIAVAVKDRMQYDDDRTVEVRLAKAVNAAPGDTQAHTLVIVNTHPQPAVAFGEAERRVREGAGRVAVPVRLTAVSGKDVTVPFTAAGTVPERAGYRVLTPSPLVIGAGSAGAEIAVEIVNDGLAEEEETVTLALDVPSGAVLGRTAALALHIEDDDPPPAASFAQERSRGAETAGPARLEVRLSGPSGRRVRVEYAVTGGTARGGAEFVLRGSALVFEPGETAKAIEAEIRPGDRHKEDRTLEVSLTRAEHAVPGGVRVHTYTIENTVPPPQVTFGEPSGSVEENAGVTAVPVRLTSLSGKDVTVPFTVSGTAVEGRDYRVVTSSPAVIRAGRSAAEITLLVEDDRLQGDDKTIILTLGAPENAALGPYPSHQLTVLDNDRRRTVAVMPFLNASTRKSAGDILTLHFIKHLLAAGRFSIIEPGAIRQHFLDTRLIMPGGIDLASVDQISNTLQIDLLFSGTVVNYQDGMGAGVEPAIDFSVVVFERKSKRVVWASKSSARGDDRVILFDWGRINVADVLASKMSGMVIDMFIQ